MNEREMTSRMRMVKEDMVNARRGLVTGDRRLTEAALASAASEIRLMEDAIEAGRLDKVWGRHDV